MVRGDTVADMTHLVAELLENAIKLSEPHTSVTVSGHRGQDSYEISIVDQGIGMSRGELQDGNQRIAEPPPERVPTKFLGLYVIGRLAERRGISVRLSDAPGTGVLARFGFMWDDLVTGALGAVVLVDSRRLADCFHAVDYFEQRGTPFVVAVNQFNGREMHEMGDIRRALQLPEGTLTVPCDARDRHSVKAV